ncbi:MAG: hypothetical protein Q8Q33_09420 [Chlamydiota bacterium]|nr:hypothetical protein [Chlamydiota bacterium]
MGVSVALFLITMGFGYYVCIKATEETGYLKLLGNIVAVIMLVVSLVGLGFAGYCGYKNCSKGMCSWKAKMKGIASETVS